MLWSQGQRYERFPKSLKSSSDELFLSFSPKRSTLASVICVNLSLFLVISVALSLLYFSNVAN